MSADICPRTVWSHGLNLAWSHTKARRIILENSVNRKDAGPENRPYSSLTSSPEHCWDRLSVMLKAVLSGRRWVWLGALIPHTLLGRWNRSIFTTRLWE